MSAPKNNEFYLNRSKHGRDYIFKNSNNFLEVAYEYFQHCIDNPLLQDTIHKIKLPNGEGEELVHEPLQKMNAATDIGLCLFMHVNAGYLNDLEDSLKAKKPQTKQIKDYSVVITHVRETIYNNNFTGAAAGLLNPNIIARKLGLTEKTDVTSGGDKIQTIDMSKWK